MGRRLEQAGTDPARLAALEADLGRAEQRLARRRAAVPAISYPPELPVSQRRDDLLEAIAEHQVVVVAGETGSGKTTQLPKLCLELGRGVTGMIGHTQPRRIAARAVAERLAEELGTEVGEAVGFAVRFTDRVSDTSLVKLMTDGILLAEIQRDRLLRNYDTIILDEAHERSLNIDFLLGYLKQLLPRRPDLKLIITSATIDPQRFAEYFDGAPVLEVSGRGYPVEVRYRPITDPDAPDAEDRDQVSAICDALTELSREPAGDVLVFLSGEREIRDTADAVSALKLPDTEVLPLYARLSAAEQHRVFTGHRGRRVVLATNVAETSLTVPGIRYVVDAGTARISRYSQRTKVQLLPIEPISRASATQRAGRCGRTSAGICIRLYAEEDFESRPQFTDPEILRTNLASVILQMAALDLGPVADFGFLDPPDARQVADGLALLTELGALQAVAGYPAPPASPSSVGGSPSCRWTPGWPGWSWRPTGAAACGTCWCWPRRCPSRTRGSARSNTSRPPTPSTPGSPTRRRTSPVTSTCGGTSASSRASCPPASSAGCAAPSTCPTCGSGSGRTCTASCARSSRRWASGSASSRPTPSRCTAACCPACCPRSGCGIPPGVTTSAPATPGSRSSRARRCSRSSRRT